MSEAAAAKAPQIDPQAQEPAPHHQASKTGLVTWLCTWKQVLIAEVLSVMEHRRRDC